MKTKLYYIHDPMCSWCYAFKKDYDEIKKSLPTNIELINIVGGLAKETSEEMPKDMQNKIKSIWQNIEKTTGTKFNYDFWEQCKPKRSTYPSCKAVLCAKEQNMENEMINSIQEAYYLKAKNPSDNEVLLDLAKNLNLDFKKFKNDFESEIAQELLINDLEKRKKLKVFSFPTLVLQYKKELYPIQIEFNNPKKIVKQIIDLSTNIYF